MSGCVLEVYGESFDVATYLGRVSLRADPVVITNDTSRDQGFHCLVSDARSQDLPRQIEEASIFLQRHPARPSAAPNAKPCARGRPAPFDPQKNCPIEKCSCHAASLRGGSIGNPMSSRSGPIGVS